MHPVLGGTALQRHYHHQRRKFDQREKLLSIIIYLETQSNCERIGIIEVQRK